MALLVHVGILFVTSIGGAISLVRLGLPWRVREEAPDLGVAKALADERVRVRSRPARPFPKLTR